MKHLLLLFLVLLGILGIWLLYWNFVEFLTNGMNNGIWDFAIIQNAFPSIALGFCILVVCFFLGVSVIKG